MSFFTSDCPHHNCIGHNYIGHSYIGHNYVGAAVLLRREPADAFRPARSRDVDELGRLLPLSGAQSYAGHEYEGHKYFHFQAAVAT